MHRSHQRPEQQDLLVSCSCCLINRWIEYIVPHELLLDFSAAMCSRYCYFNSSSRCALLAFLCCPSSRSPLSAAAEMSKQIIPTRTQFHPWYESGNASGNLTTHEIFLGFPDSSRVPCLFKSTPPGWDSNSSDSVLSKKNKLPLAINTLAITLMRDRSCDDHMRLELSWSQVFMFGDLPSRKSEINIILRNYKRSSSLWGMQEVERK